MRNFYLPLGILLHVKEYLTQYQFHFNLLLHFIGKTFLDIPFDLYKSLGKMVHRCSRKNMNKEFQMLKDEVSTGNIKLLAEARDKFDEIRP